MLTIGLLLAAILCVGLFMPKHDKRTYLVLAVLVLAEVARMLKT